MQIQSRDNDYAFQALLQSQRELLSQMKYGYPMKCGSNTPITSHAADRGNEKLVVNRRSSVDRRVPSDLTKMARGGTNKNDAYFPPNFDSPQLNMKSDFRYNSSKHKAQSSAFWEPKKRKLGFSCLPSTGFFDDVVDDDDCHVLIKPDFSESSERSELDFELVDFNDVSSLIEEKETDKSQVDQREKPVELTVVTEAETDDGNTLLNDNEIDPIQQQREKIDPEEAKEIVNAFWAAMKRSQYTQQSIHDWDKKMGLKRSHSKTMRLSARSRKKLRAMFKQEFTCSSPV